MKLRVIQAMFDLGKDGAEANAIRLSKLTLLEAIADCKFGEWNPGLPPYQPETYLGLKVELDHSIPRGEFKLVTEQERKSQ